MIFFVMRGSVRIKMNNAEVYVVFSREMFMTRIDNSYDITMLEQTHLFVCYVPMEAWFIEQNRIDDLVPQDGNSVSNEFFKLPVKKVIVRYLSLLDVYLKENIYPASFFELKRQELFFLFFFYYQKNDLAQFLQYILSADVQFRKFVLNNYLFAKNVQELARFANYSASGFIKKFQKCFNESPYKWMQKQKAKHIFVEINQGVKSLKEIANEHNFLSYQHFSGFCKAQLGSTPTEILAKNKSKKMSNI